MNFAAFDGPRRGLASAVLPALRACSETRPAATFAEQGGAASALLAGIAGTSEGAASCDGEGVLAEILEQLANGSAGPMLLTELLGFSARWVSMPTYGKCVHYDHQKRRLLSGL
mmetsp:Transcript_86336/g.227697  ORF Transcript_86336/g.227697 Transcript_86336/m.227697 type:complete len:114 (+) Transcript_86336:2-343(+)